ncbi:BSD domain-containing family protein [Salix suchowensis]|nr:BSD domain-containing family protein [Salix suchowensis]
MNFFKAVFADDPTPPDSPNSPPPSSDNSSPDPPTQHPTWSFGSLIHTLATKSESVIEIYKKDLEEFGFGLKNESALIRDVASRAVHDLPASFEASASVAQESLGQAIGGIGSTMWKSTAQIISQGRESILASDRDRDRDPLLSNTDTNRSSLGKQYSRFDAQVRALQCDFDTYCSEPEDKEDYEKWKSRGFVIDEEKEEIERLITENGVIEEIYGEVVPDRVDNESFWSRLFYRMFKLNQAEEARALLVKRAISGDEEEDLSWDFDDDKEEGDGLLSKGGESTDSDVSVVSSKCLAEEDLEWDEIEDIESNDESKGEAVGSRMSAGTGVVDLHKQLSAAEEEEDFSWDIEDEDDVRAK